MKLKPIHREILRTVRKHGPVTSDDIIELTEVQNRDMLYRNLRYLRAHGFVDRSKNDKTFVYEVN